jgi:hypothetical protein
LLPQRDDGGECRRLRDRGPALKERRDVRRYSHPVDADRLLDGVGQSPRACLVRGTDEKEFAAALFPNSVWAAARGSNVWNSAVTDSRREMRSSVAG